MSIRDERLFRVVLYEGKDSEPLSADDRFNTLSALLNKGYAVTNVRAECAVSAADNSVHVVLGRFNGKLPANQDDVRFHEIDGCDATQVLETVESSRAHLHGATPGAWKPWFPVIDYERCTHCMQCLSFCLFGVYTATA